MRPFGASDLLYRPLCPEDFEAVKAAHLELFPIKYEDTFFNKAVNSLDRIFSFAAFDVSKGYEELAGFITVRLCFIYELETVDQHYISQAGGESCASTSPAAYILTLGTVPGWQKCGVASALLALARQHAIEKLRCCAIFLHVISYNTAAIGLYTRNQYQCLGLLKDFYALPVGPQPSQERQYFDAYLFVQYLPFDALGAGLLATPWQGLSSRSWLSPVAHVGSGLSSMLSLGSMWQGPWAACMPWFNARHQQPGMQLHMPAPTPGMQQQQPSEPSASVSQAPITPAPSCMEMSGMHAGPASPPGHAVQGAISVPMALQQEYEQQDQQHFQWEMQQPHEGVGRPDKSSSRGSLQTHSAPSLFRWFLAPPR